MSDNITPRFNKALEAAKADAVRLGNESVGMEHVFLALLDIKGAVSAILKKINAPVDKIKEHVYERITPKDKAKTHVDTIPHHANLTSTLEEAAKIAKEFRHEFLGTEHFAIAVLSSADSIPCQVLKDLGIIPEGIRNSLNDEVKTKATTTPAPEKIAVGGGDGAKSDTSETALKKFSVDLTERAEKGLLDVVIGREEEIERVIHILSRKKKNNPVLVGPAGVGKTAIAEGLAVRIVKKEVP